MTDYTYRIWQNGQPPALNATNLQDMENNISANRLHRLSIGNPHQTEIGDLINVDINSLQDFQILGYYSGNWYNHSLSEFLMFPNSSLRLDGKVGINKEPEYDFDVEGSIRIEAIQPNLILESNYSEGWAGGIIWKNNGANKFGMFYNGESENLIFYDYANSQTRLYFDKNGTIWGAGDMHLAGNLYLGDYTVHASGVIASSGLTDIWYNSSEPPDHHYTWYYPSNGYVLTKIWDDESSSWITTHAIDVVNVDNKPAHDVALGYYLGDGVVDANNIKASAITSDHIQTDAIDSIHIKASAITTEKIHANAITGDKISSNVITAEHISSNTITADEIATSSLTSEVIAADAITGEHISANSITGKHISANSISGTHIKASSITGDHIVADAITGDHVKTSTLTAENIAAGAITADHIGTNTIITHSANIAEAIINRAHIQDGEITSAKIANIIESTVYASDEQGWRISKDGNAEFNNVKIRGSLEAVTLKKKTINALNGTFLITDSSILSDNLPSGQTFMLVKDNVFSSGNVVELKTDVDKREKLRIISSGTASGSAYKFDVERGYDSTNEYDWYAGTTVARVQDRILLTADDSNSPFIDIVTNPSGLDAQNTVKVRLGKLNGISDSDLNPSGWGLYSDNVYLKGKLIISSDSTVGGVPASNIAGWGYSSDTTYIDGKNIYTGTITANQIKAHSITADRLNIGGDSLLANWNFQSGDFSDWIIYDPDSSAFVVAGSGGDPAKYYAELANGDYIKQKVYATENETYYITFMAKGSGSTIYMYIYYYDADDSTISTESHTYSLTNDWDNYGDLFFTTPSGTAYIDVYFVALNYNAKITNILLKKAVGTTIIEDGSITTEKISSNSITADKIQAGAVNTDHIRFDDRTDDPAKPDDGMMWFRKDLNQIRYRSSGTTFKVWANANNTEAVLSDPDIYKVIQGSISSMTTDLHYDSGDYHYVAWKWYTSGITVSNNNEYTGHATYTEYDLGTVSGSTMASSYISTYGTTASNSNPNTLIGQHIKVNTTGGSGNSVKSYGTYIEMRGAGNKAYGLYVCGTNIPANTSIYGIYLDIPHYLNTDDWAIYSETEAPIYFAGATHISGSMYTASLKPHDDDTYNLGSDTMRYKNVYAISGNFASGISVGDIKMANDWIITEDEHYGVILQSPTGKKFRFKLEEIT